MFGPQYPDPKVTAQQQQALNQQTAITQTNLSHPNVKTPLGDSTWKITGKNPDGTPIYQNTQTLSAQQQRLMHGSGQVDQHANTIANHDLWGMPARGVAPGLQTSLGTNDYSADRQRVEDALMGRLNKDYDRDYGRREQELASKGIKVGSEAYNHSMDDFNRSLAEARTSATLGAGQEQNRLQQLALNSGNFHNQALQQNFSNQNTLRSNNVNEVNALRNGGGGQQPQFGGQGGAGVAPVDYAGLAQGQFNAQNQQYNNMWNAVGGIGATVGGWAFSDERLKTDEKKIGETDDGIGLYKYRFKGSPMMQMGVLAQDVQKKKPEAVRKTPSGFLAVNYPKALGRAA